METKKTARREGGGVWQFGLTEFTAWSDMDGYSLNRLGRILRQCREELRDPEGKG